MNNMKKVLIITYYWPPAGGPGVQRVLKFAKYLPEFGWQPIILTVKNGEYPAIDETLSGDIPDECIVYKTKILEPAGVYKSFTGMAKDEKIPVAVLSNQKSNCKKRLSGFIRLNFFIPDAKIGWIPFALRQGKKIIKEHRPDLILSSSPPPTVHLIAKKLAKWSGIKWVADFRDPWTGIHYYRNARTNFAQKHDEYLERKVLAACDQITCTSRHFLDLLAAPPNTPRQVITNGYDEIDITPDIKKGDKFTLVHVGGLTPNRFYRPFFSAIRKLIDAGKIPTDRIEIGLIGNVDQTVRSKLEQIFRNCPVLNFKGYLTHDAALTEMQSAQILLLFLEDITGYWGHIPGKLFEYMSTKNPILGIGSPQGDSAHILQQTNTGRIYRKTDSFEPVILQYYEQWKQHKIPVVNIEELGRYSRRNLTARLAALLEHLT